MKKPPIKILVVIEDGLVQEVISTQPVHYTVIDCDTAGCSEDEVSTPPPALAKITGPGTIYKPRHIYDGITNPQAIQQVDRLTFRINRRELREEAAARRAEAKLTRAYHNLSIKFWCSLTPEQQAELHKERRENK